MTSRDTARQLRQRAALCRRAAAAPTSGGRAEDLILRALADSLERRAKALEKAAADPRMAAK